MNTKFKKILKICLILFTILMFIAVFIIFGIITLSIYNKKTAIQESSTYMVEDINTYTINDKISQPNKTVQKNTNEKINIDTDKKQIKENIEQKSELKEEIKKESDGENKAEEDIPILHLEEIEEQTNEDLIDSNIVENSDLVNSKLLENEAMAIEILNLVNEERQKNNLFPLAWDEQLKNAATIRAQEASICWSHTRPDGTEYYTVNSDIVYGENLAYGYNNSIDTFNAWMNSQEHKENILYPDFKTIGISLYIDENNIWYWAQEFGY